MLEWLTELFNKLAEAALVILPDSPFNNVIASLQGMRFLNYLNWVFPVRGILAVMSGWLAAIVIFYLVQIVLRWVKMIGD